MAPSKNFKKIEFEQKLIELVKERPAIWKKCDENHMNSVIIGNHWDYIYEQLEPTEFAKKGSDLNRLWKQLWSQYLAYKRRSHGKTGQAGGRKVNFRHADSMRFCEDPPECETASYSNVDGISVLEDEYCPGDGESQVVVTMTAVEPPKTPCSSFNSSKKKPRLDPFAESLLDVVKGHDMNEFQHFCSSIAIKMQAISEKDRRKACLLQRDIQNLICDAELDVML